MSAKPSSQPYHRLYRTTPTSYTIANCLSLFYDLILPFSNSSMGVVAS